MGKSVSDTMRGNARQLRSRMTDVEQFVWYHLRGRRFQGFKFRRQVPLGSYVVDFVCLEKKLIVELDGGQHASQVEYDAARTRYLESSGFRVLRFWNHDVMKDWDVVEEVIWRELHASRVESDSVTSSRPLTPDPSPSRGEGKQAAGEGKQSGEMRR